jgi:hypothetical protein
MMEGYLCMIGDGFVDPARARQFCPVLPPRLTVGCAGHVICPAKPEMADNMGGEGIASLVSDYFGHFFSFSFHGCVANKFSNIVVQ